MNGSNRIIRDFNLGYAFGASDRTRSSSGFALIITVVLVAFLVLLLVGLATFTRVETSVATNSQDVSKARENALLGLNVAIGQMQRYAGPDQAVTARSEIKPSQITAKDQRFITGVWDTTAAAAIGDNPTAWLVSGTEVNANSVGGILIPSNDASPFFDDLNAPANSWVYLVHRNSVGADAAKQIKLRKQQITVPAGSVPGFGAATQIGSYAYWVGDEGVKASIAVTEPSLSSLTYNDNSAAAPWGDNWVAPNADYKRDRLPQFGTPRVNLTSTFAGINYSNAATVAGLRGVLALDQLRFVPNAPLLAAWQANFHEFTPLARGVLAHTNAGNGSTTRRLRSDLSAGIVAASAGVTSAVNDYWITRPVAPPSDISAIYNMQPRNTVVDSSSLPSVFSVAPVLTEAGVFFQVSGAAAAPVLLEFSIFAEFWNPYIATIQTTATQTLRVTVNTESPITITAGDGTDTRTFTLASTAVAGTPVMVARAEVPVGKAFAPGQVLQYQTTASGVLDNSSPGPATLTGSGLTNPAAPLTAAVSQAGITALPADRLTFVLEIGSGTTWSTLQSFTLNVGRPARGMAALGSPYSFSYGYELNRSIDIFTNPRAANARDPRAATFTGANHFEPIAAPGATHWTASADAVTGVGGLATGIPFIPNAVITLFDLPRQEVVSLAQLRHLIGAKPYEFTGSSVSGDSSGLDTHFVSSVPRQHNWSWETEARPSRYLEVVRPVRDRDNPNEEFDDSTKQLASLRSVDSARFQLIRGAFNINSTSSEAWSAVLGAALTDWEHQAATAGSTDDLSGAFFRTPHGAQELPLTGMVTTADLDENTTLPAAGRQLTAGQITALADAIVARLITQGKPFESLADFASSGVLSGAITDAALNDSVTTSGNPEFAFTAGCITSSDIVAAIAPFISARSDTFKIRAYGDVRNPATAEITGRAWCEAIVQRLPDLVLDPAVAPPSAADVAIADPATYPFGRKFEIISFRWLSPSDL